MIINSPIIIYYFPINLGKFRNIILLKSKYCLHKLILFSSNSLENCECKFSKEYERAQDFIFSFCQIYIYIVYSSENYVRSWAEFVFTLNSFIRIHSETKTHFFPPSFTRVSFLFQAEETDSSQSTIFPSLIIVILYQCVLFYQIILRCCAYIVVALISFRKLCQTTYGIPQNKFL